MQYNKEITLKNGEKCVLRAASDKDAEAVLEVFCSTHAQTDFLLTYPEENSFTYEQEIKFLERTYKSENEIEICAVLNGKIVGTAGISPVGDKLKNRHRAEFGIAIEKEFWGLGIGKALTAACTECARTANYSQLELDVVADNSSAVALYKNLGFKEYGRNPRGFKSKISGYQELILMRMELE